jgi:diketogulonate reductase-like aldo/keto reductase
MERVWTCIPAPRRWIVDTGVTFTTQTKSRSHFEEDLNIFDFQLTPEEITLLGKV